MPPSSSNMNSALIWSTFFFVLIFIFCNCHTDSSSNHAKTQKKSEQPSIVHDTCNCDIPSLDQYSSTLDSEKKEIIDTLSIGADFFNKSSLKELRGLFPNISGGYSRLVAKNVSNAYITKNDFQKNEKILELAITRNVFCSAIIYFCQNDDQEAVIAEIKSYQKYVLTNILETKKPEEDFLPPSPSSVLIKIEHGDLMKNIYIDGEEAVFVADASNDEVKSILITPGKHLFKIEYFTGEVLKKNFLITKGTTIKKADLR